MLEYGVAIPYDRTLYGRIFKVYMIEFLNFIGLFYASVAIPCDNFIFKVLYVRLLNGSNFCIFY